MKKGFTLIELLIVMGVLAILIAIIIPSFRGMQDEGRATRAQKEADTYMAALESYYKNNGSYPAALVTLTGAVPSLLPGGTMLNDPFKTVPNVAIAGLSYDMYTYAITTNNSNDQVYFVGSKGPNRTWDSSGGWVGAGSLTVSVKVVGDDIIDTNAPKIK